MVARVRKIATACSVGLILGLGPVAFVNHFSTAVPTVSVTTQHTVPFLASNPVPWQDAGIDTPTTHSTRVLFVGDIMLDRKVGQHIRDSHDSMYPFRKLPDGWFNTFDYAVANLEGPVTDQRRPPVKSIDFMFDPSVVSTLKLEGIDAVSQANNHALDQGAVGFEDSRRRLQAGGLLVFGHEVQDGDIALATTTVNGLKLAFLGFNTTDNPLDEQAATAVIAKAKAQADRVVVFMHWGIEYKNHPTPEMVDRAHWFIDHGVDVVIGGHPHWVQGMESYKGHPIVYSLGNFIFDQDFSEQTQEGLSIVLTFNDREVDVQPVPVHLDASQPRVVAGEELAQRLKKLADISDAGLRQQIEAGMVTFK